MLSGPFSESSWEFAVYGHNHWWPALHKLRSIPTFTCSVNDMSRNMTKLSARAPSEDSYQPWYLPGLIIVFGVHMKVP